MLSIWILSWPARAQSHAWTPLLTDAPATATLSAHYAPPQGYQRVAVGPGSFAAWMRTLPVRLDRTQVLSYQGVPLDRPSAGIIAMDVGSRDLMQCADSIIRLHAEFLWAKGRQSEAAYRFTSGDETRWADWVAGERMHIEGNRVRRTRGAARARKHTSYRRWLDLVFTYAGTMSLARDATSPPMETPVEAGEFYEGAPGHAVIVLDGEVPRRPASSGQGFMPAEDIHTCARRWQSRACGSDCRLGPTRRPRRRPGAFAADAQWRLHERCDHTDDHTALRLALR